MRVEFKASFAAVCGLVFGSNALAQSEVETDPQPFAAGLYSEGEATRLIEVAPIYPPDAVDAGTEGFVEVRFTVAPDGTVSDAEILSSEPEGIFDDAALDAMDRWRYTSNLQGEAQTLTERIEFNLADELFSLRSTATTAPRPVFAVEPLRNSCIQEQSRYDFGSVIDVSLINACEEPLVVYSCSAGTGSYSERWVCRNPEQSGTALGSSASASAGANLDSVSADQLSTVARLEISRAPNGEYWWLACKVDDTACRSDGRQWIRSMDRQTASIDPQDRTRARLARSF